MLAQLSPLSWQGFVYMKIGDVMFYIIVLSIVSIGCCYSCISFVGNRKNSKRTEDYLKFLRRLAIDVFVIAFCLAKLFPEITWL